MFRRRHDRASTFASAVPSARSTPRPASPDRPLTYEDPAYPLNESARNKLGDLSRGAESNAFNSQIKEALRNLGHAVYDMHLRLEKQRQRLEYLQTRREQRGEEKGDEEEKLEKHVSDLEVQVVDMTSTAEEMVRAAIDLRVSLEDDAAVLRELYTDAALQQPPAADEDPEPVPSTLQLYRDYKDKKKETFASVPPYERYALENDYAAFKKLWHDAKAGDDGPPLPDASRWFRPDGVPVMALGEDDGDEDDDIVVQREHISLKCPLTFTEFVEPYSNNKCKHTFEKEAILDYLRGGQEKQCPQTGGCQAVSFAWFPWFSELS